MEAFKKVALMTSGWRMQRYGDDIAEQQEVLHGHRRHRHRVACAESALLRAMAAPAASRAASRRRRRRSSSTMRRREIEAAARQVLAAMAKAIHFERISRRCRRLLKVTPVDTVASAAGSRTRRSGAGATFFNEMSVTGSCRSLLIARSHAAGCNAGNPPPADDEATTSSSFAGQRAAKDAAFRNQPNEPVPPDLMDKLLPLKYFPPDPDYVVPASLKLADERIVVDMPTSTGEIRKEERVGVLEFTLKGQPLTLGAFIEAGRRHQPAVRAVQRPDERHRNVCRRAIPRARSHADRALHHRLQQGLSTRTATTTPSSTARIRRRRTVCRCRSAAGERLPLMLQAIVFDFDGVIADSEPLHLRAYQAVLADRTASSSTREDYYARYLGYDDAGLFQALAKDRGIADRHRARSTAGSRRSREIVEEMLSERLGAVSGRRGVHQDVRRARAAGDRVRRARAGDRARAGPRRPAQLLQGDRVGVGRRAGQAGAGSLLLAMAKLAT